MENNKPIQPISILMVTYERDYFLKRVIDKIYERTRYPYRLFVIDNNSKTDGTRHLIKHLKKLGKVFEHVFLDKNDGLPQALNAGFPHVQSEYFITTQDDLIPPDLQPGWLERLVHLIEKYPEYGAICMRIQRTCRLEIDENKELIDTIKSVPSVFRIQRKSDIEHLRLPFGRLKHWESQSFANIMRGVKKKSAMATNLYAEHLGYMVNNKGYREAFNNYLTYSPERVKQGEDKPYPEVDPATNIPTKILHGYDTHEQKGRDERKADAGYTNVSPHKKQEQRDLLAKYCVGRGIDVGCGRAKVHKDAIGIDLFQYSTNSVNYSSVSADDLWMFKNGELDYVVASHILEHMTDTKKTLKEWDRVLKIGGTLGIIVPDGELRPRTILDRSHKVSLSKNTMSYLLKHFLGYKQIEHRNMTELGSDKAKMSILCVYKKI